MQYRRAWIEGGSFFFTVVTAERRPLFASREAVDVLRMAFRVVRSRHSFDVDAMVVLPDHLHCIWSLPAGDADFATRWRLIKTWFTRNCDPTLRIVSNRARSAKREQAQQQLWQHRYWEHALRDEADRARHMDYIHFNPVKHGLVNLWGNGHIRAFAGAWRQGCIHRIGGKARWISTGWGMNK